MASDKDKTPAAVPPVTTPPVTVPPVVSPPVTVPPAAQVPPVVSPPVVPPVPPTPAPGSLMVGPHAPRLEIIHGAFIVEVRQAGTGKIKVFDFANPWPLPMIPRINEALLVDDAANKMHGTVQDVRYNLKTLDSGMTSRIIIHINDSLL